MRIRILLAVVGSFAFPAHAAPGRAAPRALRPFSPLHAYSVPQHRASLSIMGSRKLLQQSSQPDQSQDGANGEGGSSGFLGGLFDGSSLRGARSFLQDVFHKESRESASNAAGYLLAVRDSHVLPTLSRERTVEALNTFRRFRLALGHPAAAPGMSLRLSASEGDSKRRIAQVAAQVRGVEMKGMRSNDDPAASDAHESHVLGLTTIGLESIKNFHLDVRDAARTAKGLLDEQPYRQQYAVRLLYAIANPMIWAAAPAMLFVGADWWPYAAAIHTVATEPYSVIKHRLAGDRFHANASARLASFLKDGPAWIFDSKTYNLEAMLVESALKHGRNEDALTGPLVNQDYYASTGIYGRLMTQAGEFKADLQLGPAGHGGQSRLERWKKNHKGVWVSVDRLLWRQAPGAEPTMAVVIRTQTERPRFPKPVRESAKDAIGAAVGELQPVPIPVKIRRQPAAFQSNGATSQDRITRF